jgi:hypothetical protein
MNVIRLQTKRLSGAQWKRLIRKKEDEGGDLDGKETSKKNSISG